VPARSGDSAVCGCPLGRARLLPPLPASRVGVPDAIGEQAVQVGKVGVSVDEEAPAFAIFLIRPLAVPRLPPRIVRVEVQARERLPAGVLYPSVLASHYRALMAHDVARVG
jgi:hypothetical protein